MSARKPWMAPPALAPRAPPLPAAAACHSEQPAPRACPRRTSRLFAPTPRVGRFAARAAGPECLAQAAGVVGDEPVGRFQDGAGGAVVLLEAEQLRRRVVAAELLQVLDPCTTEAVYGLIVVRDHERMARTGAVGGG